VVVGVEVVRCGVFEVMVVVVVFTTVVRGGRWQW
jgi:hypothetical protein